MKATKAFLLAIAPSLAIASVSCGSSSDDATGGGASSASSAGSDGTTSSTSSSSTSGSGAGGSGGGSIGCGGVDSFVPDWVKNAKPTKDIYVSPAGDDDNDGTAMKPYLTAAKAFAALAPGVRLDFAKGTYACPPFVQGLLATTASPAIIFSSDGPRAAKFDCGGNGDFFFSHVTGVIVDGVEIANASGHGVQLDSGATFDPNALSGDFVLMKAFVHDTALAGIKVAQSQRVYVIGNEFSHSGPGRQDVEFVATDAVTIVGNDAHDSDAFDEVKGGAHGGVIALNHVHDMNPGSQGVLVGGDCTGVQFLVDPSVDFEAKDLLVWSNVITGTTGAVFRVVGCHDCLVANNTGWSTGPTAEIRVIHDAFASAAGGSCDIPLHNQNVRVIDNVFAWSAGSPYVIPSDEDPNNVVFGHNLWFGGAGADVTTLGSDLPFLGEATSLYNKDPSLVSPPADVSLGAGSAALGAGVALPEVPGNFLGKCWTMPPDIGAY